MKLTLIFLACLVGVAYSVQMCLDIRDCMTNTTSCSAGMSAHCLDATCQCLVDTGHPCQHHTECGPNHQHHELCDAAGAEWKCVHKTCRCG